MDQTAAPKAPSPTLHPADHGRANAPDTLGEGEGLTGPRQFPAVNPDAIRQVFESGKYPYARLLGRAPYEVEKAKLQAELLKALRLQRRGLVRAADLVTER